MGSEEGLALALLEDHTWHEVEALLDGLLGLDASRSVLRRVSEFMRTLSSRPGSHKMGEGNVET